MRKFTLTSVPGTLIGVALCSALFSFVTFTGAHSVQVYLDDKLVIEQYIDFKTNDVRKLVIDVAEKHSNVIVRYNECGRTVTGRTLTLKDDQDKVLKTWRFNGSSTGFEGSMTCPVKEIMAFKPEKAHGLKLYYTSDDFQRGQQIAYVTFAGASTASR